jgi:hypothetical protein
MKASVMVAASLVGLACCVVVAGCAEGRTSNAGRVMTGEEIKNLITRHSIEARNFRGGLYRGYHPDSETALGLMSQLNGETFDVKGRMTFKGQAVCVAWNRKDWGNNCYQYVQDGDRFVWRNLNDRNEYGTLKVLDGNPFGL